MSHEPKAMRPLPDGDESILVRTYFGNDAAWDGLCAAIQKPVGEFRANVTPVSDRSYADATVESIVALATGASRSFVLVADKVAHIDPDHPILVVDLLEEPGRTFRVIPSEAWGVENNLSLANLDFHEFADAVDDQGIFRGFPSS